MTHDELLEKIDLFQKETTWDIPEDSIRFGISKRNHLALRAVVELHKPKEEDGKLWCSHEVCYNHIEFLERNDCDCSYPCPTIQAIESALA